MARDRGPSPRWALCPPASPTAWHFRPLPPTAGIPFDPHHLLAQGESAMRGGCNITAPIARTQRTQIWPWSYRRRDHPLLPLSPPLGGEDRFARTFHLVLPPTPQLLRVVPPNAAATIELFNPPSCPIAARSNSSFETFKWKCAFNELMLLSLLPKFR